MRSVLAVLVMFVVTATVVWLVSAIPWFLLGVDGVLVPGRFDSVVAYDVYAVVVAFAGALFAGWLGARLSRSGGAVLGLAVVMFAAGAANACLHLTKNAPGPRAPGVTMMEAIVARKEPAWFVLLVPCLGFVGVLLGGRCANAECPIATSR